MSYSLPTVPSPPNAIINTNSVPGLSQVSIDDKTNTSILTPEAYGSVSLALPMMANPATREANNQSVMEPFMSYMHDGQYFDDHHVFTSHHTQEHTGLFEDQGLQ